MFEIYYYEATRNCWVEEFFPKNLRNFRKNGSLGVVFDFWLR